MQIVIDIPEERYKHIQEEQWLPNRLLIEKAIANGTPLPKGHGRLFDERDIVSGNYEVINNRIYELEPIIEADKESDTE